MAGAINAAIATLLVVVLVLLALLVVATARASRRMVRTGGGDYVPENVKPEPLVILVLSTDFGKSHPNELVDRVISSHMQNSKYCGIKIQHEAIVLSKHERVFPTWYLRHPYARTIVVAVSSACSVALELCELGGDRIAGLVLVGTFAIEIEPLFSPEYAAKQYPGDPAAARRLVEHGTAITDKTIATIKSFLPNNIRVFISDDKPDAVRAYDAIIGESAPVVVVSQWTDDRVDNVAESINKLIWQVAKAAGAASPPATGGARKPSKIKTPPPRKIPSQHGKSAVGWTTNGVPVDLSSLCPGCEKTACTPAPAKHIPAKRTPAKRTPAKAAPAASGDRPEDDAPLDLVVLFMMSDDDEAKRDAMPERVFTTLQRTIVLRDAGLQKIQLNIREPVSRFAQWYLRHPYRRIILVSMGRAVDETAYEMCRQGGDRIAAVVLIDPSSLTSKFSRELAEAMFPTDSGAVEKIVAMGAGHLAKTVATVETLLPDRITVFIQTPAAWNAKSFDELFSRGSAPAAIVADWNDATADRIASSVIDLVNKHKK
jgi:pimeloyl-ACP methyl ester carboxylesterase